MPGHARPLPAVDDRLAPPETRLEYLGGAELFAAPADQGHATRHSDLAYVLRAHVAPGYQSAVDMLTRTDEASDFAPDASIFPDEIDLETGGRLLEELAFEVCDKQSIGVPTRKARALVARGVRRVFCVLVQQRRLLEWSAALDTWQTVPSGTLIEDRCLVQPIRSEALIEAAAADDAVAAALLRKGNPVLEEALAQGRAQGQAEGRAQGQAEGRAQGQAEASEAGRVAVVQEIFRRLEARNLSVSPDVAAALNACMDFPRLLRWLARTATVVRAEEVIADG